MSKRVIMKRSLIAFCAVVIILVVTVPVVFTFYIAGSDCKRDDFFFGVTFGAKSSSDAKVLIDKVKDYTNLLLVDSYDVSLNETTLTDICTYAVGAKLNVLPYFDFILYNVTSNVGSFYNSSTWEEYGISPFHVNWLNDAQDRWGSQFLGVYYMDEPGGNQVDRGYWGGNNVSRSGAPIRTFENVSDYSDAANRYVSGINRTRSMQILKNTSYPNGLTRAIPVFTSDYALYWFDNKAGYDTVFAQINASTTVGRKAQQIALCRGSANAQNKTWGVILTWTTDNSPYLASGADMLADMKMAYDAGAKYVVVFNYPQINVYGALNEEHFAAMREFWNYAQANKNRIEAQADTVFVLPQDYGWGMRTPEDKIWGLWPADNSSAIIWDKMNTLIGKYGFKLDIVYDDPKFSSSAKYSTVHFWNSTIG